MYRPRLLIVEDDDDLRAVLADALTAAGYYVAGQDSGADALDSVRAQRPQLIVLDVMMPGLDGIQVLAELRAVGYTMPVIMITGMPLTDARLDGASAVLQKPFDLEDFLATVRRLLGPGAV